MWCGAFAQSLVTGMLTPLGPAGGALTTQCGITLTRVQCPWSTWTPIAWTFAVCGLLVARRFNSVHSRCRPRARQQLPNHRPASLMDAELPSLDGIMELDVPTLRHALMLLRVRGHNAWAEPPAPLLFPTQCQLGRNSSCCQKPFWWRQLVAVPATISKLLLPCCVAVSDGWLVNE